MLKTLFRRYAGFAAIALAAQFVMPVAIAAERAVEPVKTAVVSIKALEMPQHANNRITESMEQKTAESSNWGMLAAALCVALLIVSRRRG